MKHKIYITEEDRWNLASLFVFKRRNVGLNENDRGLIKKFGLNIQFEVT